MCSVRINNTYKIQMLCFVFVLAVEVTLKFTYVEKYPDEPPLWEIASQENLEDSDADDVLTLLNQQVCMPYQWQK